MKIDCRRPLDVALITRIWSPLRLDQYGQSSSHIIPCNVTCNPHNYMFWSWFRQVGNDTHDIHRLILYLTGFTVKLLIRAVEWWGSSSGTRAFVPHGHLSPTDICPPRTFVPTDNMPGQHPRWTISHHGQHPLENKYPNFSLKIVKYNRIKKQCLSKKKSKIWS